MKRLACMIVALSLVRLNQQSLRAAELKWDLNDTAFIEVRHHNERHTRMLNRTKRETTKIRFVFRVRRTQVNNKATLYECTVVTCEDESTTHGVASERNTMKGFEKQSFGVRVDARTQVMTLTDTDGLAEVLLDDNDEDPAPEDRAFAGVIANALLYTHLVDAFTPLPAKRAGVGDKWRSPYALNVPPLMQMTVRREFRLVGPQIHDGREIQAINWESQVSAKPMPDKGGLLPFSISKIELVGKPRAAGTILWDAAAGRPVRIDSLQTYDLEMTLNIDERAIDGKGSATHYMVTRFHDKHPDKAKSE